MSHNRHLLLLEDDWGVDALNRILFFQINTFYKTFYMKILLKVSLKFLKIILNWQGSKKITFLIFLTLLHTAVRRSCFWKIGFKGWFWKSEIERRRVLICFQRLRFWRLDRLPPLVNMYPVLESLKVDRGLNSYFTPTLSGFEDFNNAVLIILNWIVFSEFWKPQSRSWPKFIFYPNAVGIWRF